MTDSAIVKPVVSENKAEQVIVKPVISKNETLIDVSQNESGKTDSSYLSIVFIIIFYNPK